MMPERKETAHKKKRVGRIGRILSTGSKKGRKRSIQILRTAILHLGKKREGRCGGEGRGSSRYFHAVNEKRGKKKRKC